MASVLIIVTDIFIENLPQAGFVQHNQAIQAFPTNGPDHSLDISILPRGSIHSPNFLDAHGPNLSLECMSVDAVVIPEKVFWG